MSPTRHQTPAYPGVFRMIFSSGPRQWLLAGALGLALLLAGCGTTGPGGGGTVTRTPTATSSPTRGGGMTVRPCPGPMGNGDQFGKPDLVLTPSQREGSVAVGGLVQVRLPTAQQWTFTGANGIKDLQPGGIEDNSACIWNFRATQAGTATMSFNGRPLCEPRTPCPQYVLAVTFTVKVG